MQADVNAMMKDRPAFLKAMDPNPNLDGGKGSNTKCPPDNFHDPFTGELIPRLQPVSNGGGSNREKDKDNDDSAPSAKVLATLDSYQTSSAMWSQLTKIRELRNLSAVDLGLELSMMEDFNLNLDGQGIGGLETSLEVDFDRLTGKLKAREEKIDKIMSNVTLVTHSFRCTSLWLILREIAGRFIEGDGRISSNPNLLTTANSILDCNLTVQVMGNLLGVLFDTERQGSAMSTILVIWNRTTGNIVMVSVTCEGFSPVELACAES